MVTYTEKNKLIVSLVKSGMDRYKVAEQLGISFYRVNFICTQLSEFFNDNMFNVNEFDCWICPTTNKDHD